MSAVTYTGRVSGLRERRHAQTRADIVDAAFALFAERGFAAVTMEEVARAAGVSRSTAYRRFPTKEDIVLDVPGEWLTAFDDAVAELPADASLRDAVELGALAVATHIDANLDRVRAAYAILDEAPELNVTGVGGSDWLKRVAGLARDLGGHDDEAAKVIAGAVMGAIDAMMFHWAATGGTTPVVDATRKVLDRLRPLLD